MPRFPASWRGRYPHMREEDIPLWNRFLDRFGDGWQGFDYDVRVGEPSRAASGLDAATQRTWEALTKLRVDAVGFRVGEVWVFEVKPYAGIGTVGQLVGYRGGYVREFRPVERVRMGVVTDRFVPAVGEVFREQGIQVWIV